MVRIAGPIKINPVVLGDKANATRFYNYVYALAQRGYEVHIRHVSPLDLVPRVPLLSRLSRLILLWTGLWKKTLWVDVSALPNHQFCGV